MKKTIVLLLLAAVCLYQYKLLDSADQDPYLVTDYSRLHPVKVERVAEGREERQLADLMQEARRKHLTISIAGQRHSQGGHTYYKDGIVVDMTTFNKVLSVDPAARTVRVQAGATWKDVQDAVNPYGLSVKTMQSQNIFTVGGSISINAHGRDIRNGSLIKSVESFRLLTADGSVTQVSRTENAELFPLALGGYGLFGIILDVTLSLTEDEVYRVNTDAVSVEEYARYFADKVQGNPDVHMHIARISVAPDHMLDQMYAINYTVDREAPLQNYNRLSDVEKGVIPSKLLFHLNRAFDWGKNGFWRLQQLYFSMQQNSRISRNNAMRSESEFMEYRQAGENDLLQEYFIPVDQFAGFVHSLRSVLTQEELNLLNITVRYVNEDNEAMLSYAQQNMFALVCLFNMPLSDEGQAKARRSIQNVLDRVLAHQGTYYLPYAAFPTQAQFQQAYPRYREFGEQKAKYDPQRLFMNYFYEQYYAEPPGTGQGKEES
ncbi:putative decaprenylphosphoryl-beta-D-ribose oxidase [Paenibacillus konkukensis]|uniref:Decaprenylphosphoryl-beta-D-ribose oxidase n=1 Tax=Paenibacillus konkukensis TaxID=2020716 RepID=A0ABY4RYX5_9BACL|nr:FAD-binding oxidoreductase [Paenibacillus konkukensis]UQZ86579.1 putative decaprenylphosphoryl-beta-D-ribose oxidase [Paenibacillus konkukensis]